MNISKQKVLMGISVVYIAVVSMLAIRFYDLYKYYEARVPKTEKEIEQETNMLLSKLKNIMQIPDEKPSIATVANEAALKRQQAFFAQAQNGDKVIVFPIARKAVLYRPSTDKIIESGPLLVGPNQNTQAANNQQIKPLRVAIFDGTSDPAVAQSVDERLKKAAGPVIETTVSPASSKEYTGITVVDLTGNNKQSVDDIAKFFEATVGSLPTSETKPDADVLIVVGK